MLWGFTGSRFDIQDFGASKKGMLLLLWLWLWLWLWLLLLLLLLSVLELSSSAGRYSSYRKLYMILSMLSLGNSVRGRGLTEIWTLAEVVS